MSGQKANFRYSNLIFVCPCDFARIAVEHGNSHLRMDNKKSNCCTIINFEPIAKGYSENKKYCATTSDGMKYLLRILPIMQYESCKFLYAMMKQAAAFEIPMCLPLELGVCESGVYLIQSWVNGLELGDILQKWTKNQ